MRKLLLSSAALVLAGGIALTTNLPLQTGPYDPGNALGFFNAFIGALNFGSAGLNQWTGNIASTATTAIQNFVTTNVPIG